MGCLQLLQLVSKDDFLFATAAIKQSDAGSGLVDQHGLQDTHDGRDALSTGNEKEMAAVLGVKSRGKSAHRLEHVDGFAWKYPFVQKVGE